MRELDPRSQEAGQGTRRWVAGQPNAVRTSVAAVERLRRDAILKRSAGRR